MAATSPEAQAGHAQGPSSGSDGREAGGSQPPREIPVFDMDAQENGEGEVGHGGEDAEGGEAKTADQLKEDWQFHQKLLSWVKAQGLGAEHPTLLQAEQQVQRAHRAWQEAKPKHAVSRRMQWAEAALRKARKQADKAEQSLDELEQWYQTERLTRDDHLRQCRERVRAREAHLAEITREAAEDYTAEGFAAAEADGGASGQVLTFAVRSLGVEIGPALERIRESLPDGSELHQQVTGALSSVTTLHGAVTQATRRRAHWWRGDSAGYDDGPSDQPSEGGDGCWGDDCYGDDDTWGDRRQRDGQWDGYSGSWFEYGDSGYSGGGDEGGMDTSDVAVPRWIMDEGAPPGAYGERKWKQRKVDDGSAGDQAGAQCAKTGGADDELNARREAVMQQAKFDGVEASAAEISQMDAGQLEAWAAEHLL